MFDVVTQWAKRNLVTRDDLLIQTEKENNLYRFGSEEFIRFEKNENLPSTTKNAKLKNIHQWAVKVSETKNFYTTTIPAPYVCVVKDVELIGCVALAVDSEGKVIFETMGSRNNNLRSSINHNLKNFDTQDIEFMRDPPSIDLAFSLVFTWRNYSHWLLDNLVRIQGFEHYCEMTGEKPAIIIDSEPSTWMVQSLELVGYDVADCIPWNGKRAKVNRLVLPSFRRYKPSPFYSPVSCQWLRDRILSNITNIGSNNTFNSPNIFISRKKAKTRRIVNEDELIEKLSRLDFVAYTLEDMSFADQVRLFSQAKIIVSPHGAGLVNMIFSEKPAVIELFGSTMSLVFFALAKGLGFQYDCLKCQLRLVADKPKHERNYDMSVNYDELSELIYRFM
ncbi:MAG: glycosyltransferase family 61 protein [Xenococcaceae cyanobacterium MO_207.B15]|nr:glycosyltransferase family 61 protein [Xenococcaceae cyanobacterium MO_207.B15]